MLALPKIFFILLRRLLLVLILLSSFKGFAQLQILKDSIDVSGNTITFCGNGSFSLTSSVTAPPLQWSVTQITSGSGTLSISNDTVVSPIFNPSISGIQVFQITLSNGINSVSTTLVFGPKPSFGPLSIPSSVCENGGNQTLTTSITANQSITASAGTITRVSSTVQINPQGVPDGISINLTLTETYAIPGTTSTFNCSKDTTIVSYTATVPTLNLNSNSFQKCSSPVTLSGGSPSGGTYTIDGQPNAVDSLGRIDPSQLNIGNYDVRYTYTDGNGCTASVTQQISITSFVFTQPGLNFTVGEVTALGFQPIQSSTYNGLTTYYVCSGGANATFQLLPLSGLSDFTFYEVDWRDGTNIQTGTISSSNPIAHQYNVAGLYEVYLKLITPSGCFIQTTINLYFGTTQSLYLGTPGNTTVCLNPDQDSVTYDFEIGNWSSDPDGISYTFTSNDSSTSKTAVAPLVKNGVSQYPGFIVFDSITQKAFYRHSFKGSSCSYTSILGGTTFDNTFNVAATKTAPCPGSQSTAAIGPIVISQSPNVTITAPDYECTETDVFIEDISSSGNMVQALGNTFRCDDTTKGYWEVFDDKWDTLALANSVYVISSGSFGSNNGFPTLPAYWNTGSQNITLKFLRAGTYNILKHIGLTANGSSALCATDVDTVSICIDTIPIIEPYPLPEFICLGSDIEAAVFPDSTNCILPTNYQFTVYDSLFNQVFQSLNTPDTSFIWKPQDAGVYFIEYKASNDCGSTSILDTTYVFGADFSFLGPDSACAPAIISAFSDSISSEFIYNWTITPDGNYNSIKTISSIDSSSVDISFYDILYPNLNQTYTLSLTITLTNGCSVSSSQSITLYSRPKAGFSVPLDSCGPYALVPLDTSKTTGTISEWYWTLTGPNGSIDTSTSSTPLFNLPRSFNGTAVYSLDLQVTDSNGCIDTTTQSFSVYPTPTASFTLDPSTCTGSNINTLLINSSLSNDSTSSLDYLWTIDSAGTLTTSTDSIPSYVLRNNNTSAITYYVTLQVSNLSGCDSTVLDSIVIFPNAIAEIETKSLFDCAPFTVDTSVIAAVDYTNNGVYTWYINGVDGTNITSSQGRYSLNYTILNSLDSVWVKLVVSSAQNCLEDTDSVLVYTLDNPDPFWSLDTSQGCAPFLPSISSLTDSTVNHSWFIYRANGSLVDSFINTITPNWSALSNTSYTFDSTYTIKHITQAGTGCKDSLTLSLTVVPTPLAAFSMDSATCAPWAPVIITNTSNGNGLTYNWSIDNLLYATFNDSSNIVPTLDFTDLQWPLPDEQYNLSLTVTSDDGCSQNTSQSITLYSRPKAGFSVPLDSCGPYALVPLDTSKTTGTISEWYWTLTGPNGSIDTSTSSTPLFNLPRSFNGTAVYSLDLQVTDSNGCIDTTTQSFSVYPTPTASFTLDPSTCTGSNINTLLINSSLSNDSTSSLDYLWTIDSAGTLTTSTDSIPSYVLRNNNTSAITYYVTLQVSNLSGCDSTVLDSIVIFPNAIAEIETKSLFDCAPFTVDTSVIAAVDYTNNGVYTWYINGVDGTNITSSQGRYSLNYTILNSLDSVWVKLVVSSAQNCLEDTDSVLVYTLDNPDPFWSLDTSQGCAPFLPSISSLTDSTVNHSWFIYRANGSLVDSFINTITPNWSALSNTSYTFDSTYTIKHITQAGTGCKDSLTLSLTVVPTPLAAFSMDSATCAPWAPVIITNTSNGNGLTYNWSIDNLLYATFNDSSNIVPTLDFTDLQWPLPDEQYNLSLTVTSDDGCSQNTSQSITLYSRPKAGFSVPLDSCGPYALVPLDTSKTTGTISEWYWTLTGPNGSIDTSTSSTPLFNLPRSFNGTAVYSLDLQVTDSNGCIDTTTQSFSVYPTPTASFTLDPSTCTGSNINTLLINSSLSNDSTSSLDYLWTIDSAGTLTTSTDSIPSYVLRNNNTSAITYYVTLQVSNLSGCDSTVLDSIVIFPNAIAEIETKSLFDCAPFTVDTSVIAAVDYTNNGVYTWYINGVDGTNITSSQGRYSLNYTILNSLDSVWVKLVVSSAQNCLEDTDSVLVYTLDNPDPFWSLDTSQGCAPFLPSISSLTDSTVNHSWFIYRANGSLVDSFINTITPNWSALSNTSYTFDSTYTIKHITQAGTGCKDSLTLSLTVVPTPLAAFSMDSATCAPWAPVIITNTSNGNGLTYNWSIDNLLYATFNDSSNIVPTLDFTDLQWPLPDEQYNLSLTVTSDDGCSQNTSQSITLYSRPKAGFSVPLDSCGPYALVPLDTSKTTGTISEWYWTLTGPNGSIDTSTSSTPLFNLPRSFNGTAVYSLDLQVTDSNGCIDTTTQSFSVYPTPTASFTLDPSTCTGSNINTLLINSSLSNDSTSSLDYLWTIDSAGTLTTSTDSIPSYVLRNNNTSAITYYVTLQVSNLSGCDSTVLDSIVIFPNAIAEIETKSLFDCAPFTVDTSVIAAVDYTNNGVYTWYINGVDGTNITSSQGRYSLNYTILNSLDSVWVKLVVSSAQNCLEDTDSVLVYTLDNPDPFFVTKRDTGCTAFNPIIDSLGQTGGLHIWKVFDSNFNQIGPTLTGINPSLPTLINTGTVGLSAYSLEHTIFVSDSSSCDTSYSTKLYVRPLSVPIIPPIGDYCSRDTILFFGSSSNDSNVESWTWSVGNDTLIGQNITYYNQSPGDYLVSLMVTTFDGCDTSVFDTLTIHSYPKAIGFISECGKDTVCQNQTFAFNDSSITYSYGGLIIDYQWDFDNDGTVDYTTPSGTHNYSTIGDKEIRLTITSEFGCLDDTVFSIYVNAPPLASFEIVEDNICGPSTFNILVNDTGIVDSSYYELFAMDGNNKVVIQDWNSTPNTLPILVPNYVGDTMYFMSRSLFNCCGSTRITDSIIVQTPPVANFVILPDSGCTPFNTILQFDGLIKGQADSAYVDFGDGSDLSFKPTILSQGSSFIYQWGQVNHTFTYGGNLDTTYYVTLSVFNHCGDSSLTLPVYLQPNTVQAAFGMNQSSGCSPLTVDFTNYSYNANSVVWCFDWDSTTVSCNGGGSTALNPTWIFTQSGTYNVALIVDNGCGYDTAFQSVTVFPSPSAVISRNNNNCSNDTVNFISNSTVPAGWIASYLWEFGNGDTSILQNVDYLYDTAGTYLVNLTVTSSTGCSDSAMSAISISPAPVVSFSTMNVCLNDTTFFDNQTSIPSGTIIGSAWYYGDGNSSNQYEPYHIYSAAGSYNVTLVHTSNFGCVDSNKAQAIVHELPQLSFNVSLTSGDSCSIPQTYTFINSSSNAIQYNWDFDYATNPGTKTSSLNSPSYTFNKAGVYKVALFAENAFGCRDSIFQNIIVRDGVIARNIVNPLDGCKPLEIYFKDTSLFTASLDTINSVQWFFGDGTSTTQTSAPYNLTHSYPAYGSYSVYSVVTMNSGCEDTAALKVVNVYPTPDADFSVNKININTRLFQNNTQFIDSSITYSWTFSDGQSSSEGNPIMTFDPSTTGLDSIKSCLTVINSYGCIDSVCKSFWVWPANLIVPNAFAPGLNYIGEDALFLPKGHSLEQYEIWIYDKWGNEVWYSNEIEPILKSPAKGWDGRHIQTEEDLPMGVYAWRIYAVFDDGSRWQGEENQHGYTKAYGTLTLIR